MPLNEVGDTDSVYGDAQTLDRVKELLRREFSLHDLEGPIERYTFRGIVAAIKKRNTVARLSDEAATRIDQTHVPGLPKNGRTSFTAPGSPVSLLDAIRAEDMAAPAAFDILKVCLGLAVFLMRKNLAYGNSALEPVRAMSKADPAEQIRVRMDDKLSRMIRGTNAGEDPAKDFVGYWVLLQILENRRPAAKQTGD